MQNSLQTFRTEDTEMHYGALLGRIKVLSKKVRFSYLLQQNTRDAFLSEVLYEADKALEKFAAAPRECACLQDGRWSRR